MDADQEVDRPENGTNYATVMLIIGVVMALVGSFMKMQHWAAAKETNIAGKCLGTIAAIILIINAMRKKK